MKTRILFVIDGIEFGGGERGFAQIINGLPESRYETFLASGPQETFYHAVSNSPVQRHPVDFSNRCNPSVLIDLIRIIRNDRIDIVHGQGARADFYARLASGFSRKTMYASTVQMPVEGYDVSSLKRLLYRAFDRFSERFVDRFLVVSDSLVKSMIQTHGVAPEKVIKIYNGIEIDEYEPNVEEFRSQESEVRREFALARDAPVIGAIGRLVWQKGFEYLIEAVPQIASSIPEARFLIVGEGPLRKELVALSRELGVNERVIFTGFRSDIRDILAAVDLLVVPSLLEGFPMITLEAMAMAKPIVATNIDGITEQITNGENGILVSPRDPTALANAVIRLLGDRETAQQMGMAARGRVEREFSVEKMVSETEKVYQSLA